MNDIGAAPEAGSPVSSVEAAGINSPDTSRPTPADALPPLDELIAHYQEAYPQRRPGFLTMHGNRIRALGGAAMVVGAAAALHVNRDAGHSAGGDLAPPSPQPPVTAAPSPDYMEQATLISSPTTALTRISEQLAERIERVTPDETPAPTETKVTEPSPSATPGPTEELADEAPDATETPATSTDSPLVKEEPTDQPTEELTAEPPATATEQPTATLEVRYDDLVEQLLQETGIGIELASDFFDMEDFADIYDFTPSQADEYLKEIISSTILGLPAKLREALIARASTIIIARTLPAATTPEEGVTSAAFFKVPFAGRGVFYLEVPNGPAYDAFSFEDVLPSELQPADEAELALNQEAYAQYLQTEEGAAAIADFLADNPPDGIDPEHPEYQYFLNGLGFPADTAYLPLEVVIARIQGLIAIGEHGRVDEIRGLGVLDFSRYPALEVLLHGE